MSSLGEEEVGGLLRDEPVHVLGWLVDQPGKELFHSLALIVEVVFHVEVVVPQLELILLVIGGGGQHLDQSLDHAVPKPLGRSGEAI